MPLQTGLPGLEAPPEMVQAAIRGVEVVDMRPPGGAEPANVIDTEPEAAENAVIGRVERRMYAPKGLKSLETSGNRGINAGEARMLRTYLSESAIALYLDRFARLNQNYDRADLGRWSASGSFAPSTNVGRGTSSRCRSFETR